MKFKACLTVNLNIDETAMTLTAPPQKQPPSTDKSVSGIYVQIYQKVMTGEVNLPSFPDITLKVRAAIRNPNINLKSVAKIIHTDPPLTARIIQFSNGPLFRTTTKNSGLQDAIRRLGFQTTKNIVYSYSLRALFQGRTATLRKATSELWLQSTRVGAISSIIATHCSGVTPDKALLAGLLHDIGSLPLLAEISKHPKLAKNRPAIDQILHAYSSKVGVMLLTKWDFEEDLIEVVRNGNNWQRDTGKKIDLTDTITLARIHSYVGTDKMKDCPRINEIPAFKKLAVNNLTPEFSLNIIEEAKEELDEIEKMLGQ